VAGLLAKSAGGAGTGLIGDIPIGIVGAFIATGFYRDFGIRPHCIKGCAPSRFIRRPRGNRGRAAHPRAG